MLSLANVGNLGPTIPSKANGPQGSSKALDGAQLLHTNALFLKQASTSTM